MNIVSNRIVRNPLANGSLLTDNGLNLFLSDHPKGHVSFASTHEKDCFTQTSIPEPRSKTGATLVQDLWPDHCVQGTGASQ